MNLPPDIDDFDTPLMLPFPTLKTSFLRLGMLYFVALCLVSFLPLVMLYVRIDKHYKLTLNAQVSSNVVDFSRDPSEDPRLAALAKTMEKKPSEQPNVTGDPLKKVAPHPPSSLSTPIDFEAWLKTQKIPTYSSADNVIATLPSLLVSPENDRRAFPPVAFSPNALWMRRSGNDRAWNDRSSSDKQILDRFFFNPDGSVLSQGKSASSSGKGAKFAENKLASASNWQQDKKEFSEDSLEPVALVASVPSLVTGSDVPSPRLNGVKHRLATLENLPKESSDMAAMSLSFSQVIERVLSHNVDVAIAKNRVEKSKGDLLMAAAPMLPSIRAFYNQERFNGGEVVFGAKPVNLDRTTLRPTLSADWSINTGGKAFYQIKAARYDMKRVDANGRLLVQKALLDTCSLYFTWLRDYFTEQATTDAMSAMEDQLRYFEARARNGQALVADVEDAYFKLKEKENQAVSARSKRLTSANAIVSNLNLPFATPLTLNPKDALVPLSFSPEPSEGASVKTLPELLKTAEAHRSDIQELVAQINQTRAQYGAARADLFPNITFSGFVRRIGQSVDSLRNTSSGTFMFSVDLLRNMGVGVMGNMKSTEAKVTEALLMKEKQLLEIRKTVTQSFLDVNLYRDQLNVENQRLTAAREQLRVNDSRLKQGSALPVDVSLARAKVQDAQVGYQTAVMNLNISQLKLLYETGQLQPEVLLAAEPMKIAHH
jgi:outer membrane protein, multidrug efflux system